ncbi:MAG: glycosyltransferase [Caulobacteraceae bacterium]
MKRGSGEGEVLLRLSELLEISSSQPPAERDLTAFHQARAVCDEAMLDAAMAAHLAGVEVNAAAAMRLLEQEAARGFSPSGLRLVDIFVRRFEGDERFADILLRFQLALAQYDALVASAEGLLGAGPKSTQVAYRLVISLNRAANAGHAIDEGLHHRAVARFLAVARETPERGLWLGRYYREMGNTIVALKHYMAAWEALPRTSRFKDVALREASDLALSSDQWGRDAPVLLRAREVNIGANSPWRARAAAKAFDYVAAGAELDARANLPGTTTYSHLYAMLGTPEIAFDHLIDEILPARVPYEPTNALVMVGTSLAGGGMERIFANSYSAVMASGAFERVRMALLNFKPETASAFYLAESGADADDIAVLAGQGNPQFPVSLLPIGLGRRVWAAYEIVMRERPRVIHAWNDLPGIVAAYAGLLAGCPRIFVHFHHMRAINLSSDRNLVRSYPHCYRRALERPEIQLLFVAEASADDYADWWSVARSPKFKRLYNGFAELEGGMPDRDTARAALDLPANALVVGTAFRFHAVKRPLLWIEAALAIHRRLPGVVFVMVGGGPLWQEARSRVAALGLDEVFRFPGQVKNVADYLVTFDLFMLTSLSEGLPNSLVEAQLAGVPVLSTDVGGARETFRPGVTGRLAPAATPEALAEAAVGCLTDEAWRSAAKEKARDGALRAFGIERYMENLLALYGDGPERAPEKP